MIIQGVKTKFKVIQLKYNSFVKNRNYLNSMTLIKIFRQLLLLYIFLPYMSGHKFH